MRGKSKRYPLGKNHSGLYRTVHASVVQQWGLKPPEDDKKR